MLNLKLPSQKNRRGFSLIEVILVICLSSILLITAYSILHLANNTLSFAESEDEILLNGRFITDYIKNEIKESDLVISSNKISNLDTMYPSNIGFVVMQDKGEGYSPINERYNFFTYYLNGDRLIRIAYNKSSNIYPDVSKLSGFNELCVGVLSMDGTNLDFNRKLLQLSISLGNGSREVHCFKTTLYLATILDY